jgi:hypothetical protein
VKQWVLTIRLEPNLKINYKGQTGIMSDLLNQDEKYEVEILSWDEKVVLFRNQQQGKVWFIVTKLTGMEQEEGIKRYATRFCIEKIFQNLKSSGSDLEETKKYSRFKRLFLLPSIQLFSVVR